MSGNNFLLLPESWLTKLQNANILYCPCFSLKILEEKISLNYQRKNIFLLATEYFFTDITSVLQDSRETLTQLCVHSLEAHCTLTFDNHTKLSGWVTCNLTNIQLLGQLFMKLGRRRMSNSANTWWVIACACSINFPAGTLFVSKICP